MVKNLLFDLGGVIMDIERQNCVDSFKRLGMANAADFFGEYSQKGPFFKLEEGTMSESDFRAEIRKLISPDVSDEEIDIAFCNFLIGIPEHRLEALSRLKAKYGTYLLSNTNSIMWNRLITVEFRKAGHDIDFYFDGIVTSYEAKCSKPDPRIFEKVVSKFGINPRETLFLDDSLYNIEAAAALGFEVALVEKGTEFIDLIQ